MGGVQNLCNCIALAAWYQREIRDTKFGPNTKRISVLPKSTITFVVTTPQGRFIFDDTGLVMTDAIPVTQIAFNGGYSFLYAYSYQADCLALAELPANQ